MSTINSDKAWKKYGKENPYYGVLTDDKYKGQSLSEESKKQFFDAGKEYAERVFRLVHKHVDPEFNPKSVLDFGCGTGRLTIGFAPNADRVVGIDISEGMLLEARANSESMGHGHIEYYLSDDKLSAVANDQFDLVNSYIVLQHINVERGMKIIQELIDKIKPEGIGVLQLNYACNKTRKWEFVDYFRYRIPLVHGILNVMQGQPYSAPLMQMNTYNMNDVFHIMQNSGIKKSHVSFEDHGTCWGVTLIFQKKNLKV